MAGHEPAITDEDLDKFRHKLAFVAWRSYVRRMTGYNPRRSGKIPQTKKDIDRYVRKTGYLPSEMMRIIDHLEAMQPTLKEDRSFRWPGEFQDDAAFRRRAMSGVHPLRLYRTARGIGFEKTAKLLGIHFVSLWRYEIGEINVSVERAHELCGLLGVHYTSFLAAWGKWYSCRKRFLEGDDSALMEYFRYVEEEMTG